MATQKQIDANRRNSKKSTGPRTKAGKDISRFNAVRHALTGQLTIVAADEQHIYLDFEQTLTASLRPVDAQELHVAARIVRDTWRLHRAAANEENIYALSLIDADAKTPETVALTQATTFLARSRDFNLASLYEQRLNRSLQKDYALFRELQKGRKREEKQGDTTHAASSAGFVLSPALPAPFGYPADAKIAPQIVHSTSPWVSPAVKLPTRPLQMAS